jgi:hypothetical protein
VDHPLKFFQLCCIFEFLHNKMEEKCSASTGPVALSKLPLTLSGFRFAQLLREWN